ncbi:hypothetical protein HUW51_19280 [Adhaeribacter swui]|uniref:Leucine-rich repeat domain-containing protein n=1 Tax=Adhaeribacter swui TaxID=2086471 RepID=A0A7G7GC81_9BACT|nr:hypothetical protein [Adhaeribacter swui]QNF34765.1 hypothetical protein HUW51_19280 [Adhaeribacter swui]
MILFDRINNPAFLDTHSIESDLSEGKTVVIQFSEKVYDDKILADLNMLCAKNNELLEVRFYGHYEDKGRFDCKILEKLPEVKSLYMDCLYHVENLSSLTKLKHLHTLSIGFYELRESELLNSDNLKSLQKLLLFDTRSKALKLKYLEDYQKLNYLICCGHTKNIEALGELSNLEELSLNSISKAPIGFVNKLKKLKILKLILGGRSNINEIEENDMEELEIIRVRGFTEINNIASFRKLKKLQIEDLIQLNELVFEKPLQHLEELAILNCKSFSLLDGLDKTESLRKLWIYKTNLDFDNLINKCLPKSLNTFGFYTSKVKVDKEIQSRIKSLGYLNRLEKA